MIKAIALDDEPLALKVIESHAARVPFLQLLKTTTKVTEAILLLQQQPIDLVFLDVQMPELTGLQFMKLIQGNTKVVLTTAYEKYALDSYEYDVIDYLLKPILFERFLKAVQKTLSIISTPNNAVIDSSEKELPLTSQPVHDFIFVKTEYRLQKIKHTDILFIEGGKDYTTIHTTKEKILSLSTLAKLQEVLPYPQFIRVHKSYVIALHKIDSIERQRIFIGKEVIPVGDAYKQELTKQIGNGI
jgi:two-component system LytT family response regulator